MNVTAKAAASLWCPFVRATLSNNTLHGVVGNSKTSPETAGWNACIADRCMAWRWSESPTSTFVDLPASASPTGDPVTYEEPRKDRMGFCGLSGAPSFRK